MFSPQEVRNIESAAQKRWGQSYLSIEHVPVEFRDRVLAKRAKLLGFVEPEPVVTARSNSLAAMLSL